jgi:sulfotransferase family protein
MSSAKWIPARCVLAHTRSTITWMNFAGRSLDDPFFDQTIRRFDGVLEQYDSDLRHEPAMEPGASLEPTAFIFHMSRCGSTLFSNCLRAVDDAIVIGEAQPCNAALTPYSELVWPFEPAEWPAERDRLLRRFVACLGQRLKGNERRFFVKFSSWNTMRLGVIRALWPTTPCIFLSRDPVEVMVSNLSSNTGWMTLKYSPAQSRALFGWRDADSSEMSLEEYCARVLGQFCWTAKSLKGPRDLVLDYRDLNLTHVIRVLSTLNIQPSEEEAARMVAQFGIYAKDPLQERGFEEDSAEKRTQATSYQREMAAKWAYPAYERLQSRYGVSAGGAGGNRTPE